MRVFFFHYLECLMSLDQGMIYIFKDFNQFMQIQIKPLLLRGAIRTVLLLVDKGLNGEITQKLLYTGLNLPFSLTQKVWMGLATKDLLGEILHPILVLPEV